MVVDLLIIRRYSDIITQINFLDWEGDFSKEVESEERINCSDFLVEFACGGIRGRGDSWVLNS